MAFRINLDNQKWITVDQLNDETHQILVKRLLVSPYFKFQWKCGIKGGKCFSIVTGGAASHSCNEIIIVS